MAKNNKPDACVSSPRTHAASALNHNCGSPQTKALVGPVTRALSLSVTDGTNHIHVHDSHTVSSNQVDVVHIAVNLHADEHCKVYELLCSWGRSVPGA